VVKINDTKARRIGDVLGKNAGPGFEAADGWA